MAYRVAVITGGEGFDAQLARSSANDVRSALGAAGHEAEIVEDDEDLGGQLASGHFDVAFVQLAGLDAESGAAQALCEFVSLPCVGSSAAVCRVARDKSTLPYLVTGSRLDGDDEAAHWPWQLVVPREAFERMGARSLAHLASERVPGAYPVCVKPVSQAGGLGVSRVEREEDLTPAFAEAFRYADAALLQEWVDGVELVVTVLGEGSRAYALPPVEVSRATGQPERALVAPVRPERLSASDDVAQSMRSEIERAAIEVHMAYGCRDISRVDLFWDGAQARVLELGPCPLLGADTPTSRALDAAGLAPEAVLDALVQAAVLRG